MNRRFDPRVPRPLVLDAAMGTRLIARGLHLDHDDPALWNRDHPEAVWAVHRLDVEAGADVLVTNTFGADPESLSRVDQGDFAHRARLAEDLLRQAVAIARDAAGPNRLLFGSIGPRAVESPFLIHQAKILTDSGVDALLLETQTPDSARRGLEALEGRTGLPLVVSLFRWDRPPADWVGVLLDLGVSVLGVNCVPGMAKAIDACNALRDATNLPFLAKPGAGLPGQPLDPPEVFARAVPQLIDRGARLVGGCCGSTEAHVAALREALDRYRTADAAPARPTPPPTPRSCPCP